MAIYSTRHGYLDRRTFLKLAGITGASVAAAGTLAACGGSASSSSAAASSEAAASEAASSAAVADAATDTVVIAVYSGQWEDAVRESALDRYAEQTGLDVQIVTGADAEFVTRITAANGQNPPYDVAALQVDAIKRLIEADLLEELSADNIPNIEELIPDISSHFEKDGKLYAAAWSIGQLGLGYRKDLVSKAPTSWADLADPAFAGQVAVSPPTYSAGLQFFWGLTDDGKDIDGAFEAYEAFRPNVVATPDDAGTIQTLIQNGDIAVVPFWDGRVFALQDAGDENIEFVYPEEGPVSAVVGWVIPKGAVNRANAYDLVNFLSSADTHTRHAPLSMYGMSNANTEYSDDFKSRAHVGTEYAGDIVWVDYDYTNENLTELTERFGEIFS